MARHRDWAADDVVRQFPQSQRRSLFSFKHLAPSDDVTTDSESIYSDEKGIFNAIVVPTSSRDSWGYETMYSMGALREEGLAANLALFIPTSSSGGSPPLTSHPHGGKKQRKKAEPVWWRHQALSEQFPNRPTQMPSSSSEMTSMAEAIQSHRKAVSLDTGDTNERSTNWPGKPGPAVVPNQPRYPPPERIPTPPGLPSFNTPEAVYASAQFLTGQDGGRFYAQRNAAGAEQGSASYRTTFRRIFCLPSSVEARINMRSAVGIGRADNGTIVHGRFPYRQSGHNANMARQIHDHPFYDNTLPTTEGGERIESEGSGAKGERVNIQPPGRRDRGYVPPSTARLWSFHDGLSLPSSSATPQSGISDRAHSFFGITRTPTRPDGINGLHSTTRQTTEAVTNHIPSHHSQLHSVHTIDEDSDSDADTTLEGTRSTSDILAWLPLQLYLCCLLKPCPFQGSHGDVDGLQNTASRDTYVTAQSRPSASTTHSAEVRDGMGRFGKIEVPRWIGEAWSWVSPYTLSLSASRVSDAVRSN